MYNAILTEKNRLYIVPSLSTIFALIQAKLILLKSAMLAITAPYLGLALSSVLFYFALIVATALLLYVVVMASIKAINLIQSIIQSEQQTNKANLSKQPTNTNPITAKIPTKEISQGNKYLEETQKKYCNLEFANNNIRADKDIVLTVVKQRGLELEFASYNLKKDKEVVTAAVNEDPRALEFVGKDCDDYKKIALNAVNNNPWALKFVSEGVENYKVIVLAAVQNSVYALNHASDQMKNDKEVVLLASSHDTSKYPEDDALHSASNNLKNDIDFKEDIATLKSSITIYEAVNTADKDHPKIILPLNIENDILIKLLSLDINSYFNPGTVLFSEMKDYCKQANEMIPNKIKVLNQALEKPYLVANLARQLTKEIEKQDNTSDNTLNSEHTYTLRIDTALLEKLSSQEDVIDFANKQLGRTPAQSKGAAINSATAPTSSSSLSSNQTTTNPPLNTTNTRAPGAAEQNTP